ncbi:ester cyclase [Streptomyces sp. H39-S7]|uniref:ester cyclase n=1 Tax=Streptomyces sp. H39-S7 TaxID=3004357 RepID=UPI0022AE93B3|nr:ester cyclase [Streptomyces sp. H39-S7]MCZ4122320.1 ester cyclase [Streptomyces sp. H39-S7]
MTEKNLLDAFTALRVEVLDQIAEGTKVATRWQLTATQTSEFFGVPSQGRTATLPFAMGQCTDRYLRTPDGWKIASRACGPFFLRGNPA